MTEYTTDQDREEGDKVTEGLTLDRTSLTHVVKTQLGGLSEAAAILGMTDAALSMRLRRDTVPRELRALDVSTARGRLFNLAAYREHAARMGTDDEGID